MLTALVAAASALQAQPKPGLGPSRPGLLSLRGGASLKEETSLKGAPPFVKACASFSAMDSLLLGYDIGCISGILLFVQEEFALNSHQVEVFASAMNSAALVGALFSGYIADKFGRKPALFMSSCTFALGSILMAVATSYDMLVYSRYIQGFGVGAGLLISPMFISEVAPKQWRGALVTLSEVALSLGILLAYIVNYLLSGVDSQWRWMIGLGAAPDVLLALRMLFLPESPRFLVGKGKLERARKVQRRILHRPGQEEKVTHAEADAELAEIIKGKPRTAAHRAAAHRTPHHRRTPHRRTAASPHRRHGGGQGGPVDRAVRACDPLRRVRRDGRRLPAARGRYREYHLLLHQDLPAGGTCA